MDRLTPRGQVVVVLDQGKDGFVPEITAGAAVFFWDGRAKKAHFTGLVPDRAFHDAVFTPAFGARLPFGLKILGCRVLKHDVVFIHPVGFEVFELHYLPLSSLCLSKVYAPRYCVARGELASVRQDQNASAGMSITGSAPDWMRARRMPVSGKLRDM